MTHKIEVPVNESEYLKDSGFRCIDDGFPTTDSNIYFRPPTISYITFDFFIIERGFKMLDDYLYRNDLVVPAKNINYFIDHRKKNRGEINPEAIIYITFDAEKKSESQIFTERMEFFIKNLPQTT